MHHLINGSIILIIIIVTYRLVFKQNVFFPNISALNSSKVIGICKRVKKITESLEKSKDYFNLCIILKHKFKII